MPFAAASGATFLDIQHPGFRMFTTIQIPQYTGANRTFDVKASQQEFYNLQRIEGLLQ